MAVAQGLYKQLAFKKQSGLGTPATGSGGTQLRRETATFEKTKAAISTNEIVAHQQYTGDTYGVAQTQGQLSGLLSAGSYAPFMASLIRGALNSAVALTGLSITIAGTAPTFTLTRSAGSWITDGVKLGDVVRLTAGTFTGVASNLNLLVVAETATVLTVVVPNGKSLIAQGPVASATLTVVNKKVVAPSTGQANDYYTVEEWFSDIARSRLYTDTQVSSVDLKIPANGNVTIQINFIGLGRTEAGTQQLTSPSAASTTAVIGAANAEIILAGNQMLVGTSVDIKIDGQLKAGEAVVGSKTISDTVKGDLKVTGTVAMLKQDETYSTIYENETTLPIIVAAFVDTTDTSDFVSFVIPMAKLFKDQTDDGKKQIVSTFDFTAQYNSAGGAAANTDTGIITMQDSQA